MDLSDGFTATKPPGPDAVPRQSQTPDAAILDANPSLVMKQSVAVPINRSARRVAQGVPRCVPATGTGVGGLRGVSATRCS